MTLPSAGNQIAMSQINAELLYNLNTGNTSLSGRSWELGNYNVDAALKAQPAQMSKWAGKTYNVQYYVDNVALGGAVLRFWKSGGTYGTMSQLDITMDDNTMTWTITSDSTSMVNFGGYSTASGKGPATLSPSSGAPGGGAGYAYGPWTGVTVSTNSPNYGNTTVNVTWV